MLSFEDFQEVEAPTFKSTYQDIIDKFIESGKKSVFKDCGGDVVRIHRGLYGAARKKQYRGRVLVLKQHSRVYLVRVGE